MEALLLPFAVLLTATISGVFGMAGGLALLAILLAVLPVEVAMVFHGSVQAASNGSRFWLHRSHTLPTRVIWAYALGAGCAVLLCLCLALRVDAREAYLALGLLTLVGLALPKRRAPSFAKPKAATLCGVATGFAHLTAGVSGPILDAFFLRGDIEKRAVLATKACTQTLSHTVKVAFWALPARGAVAAATNEASEWPAVWIWVLSICCAFAGSALGRRIVLRLSETRFQRYSRSLVAVLGLVCLIRAVTA